MIKKRIIFTFYYCDGFFVQSRNFDLQRVGNINWIKKNYNLKKISNFIDEVAIINLSSENSNDDFIKNLKQLAKSFLVPIMAGGRIKNFEDVKKYFNNGCDKIILNSNLYRNIDLIEKVSKSYGSQSIVASIDYKKNGKDSFIFINNGKKQINEKPSEYLKKILKMNIGEVLLRSIDKDGSGEGLDFNFLKYIPNKNNKNIILAGGSGNVSHIEEGLKNKNINAVCTGNLFNFISDELKNTRQNLLKKKFNLATWNNQEIEILKNKFK